MFELGPCLQLTSLEAAGMAAHVLAGVLDVETVVKPYLLDLAAAPIP